MNKMSLCIDHNSCNEYAPKTKGGSKPCLWPLYHKDKKTVKEHGTIQNMPVLDKSGIRAAGLRTQTRMQAYLVQNDASSRG